MSSITGGKMEMEEELQKFKNVNFAFSTLNCIRGETQLFMYFSKAVKKTLEIETIHNNSSPVPCSIISAVMQFCH